MKLSVIIPCYNERETILEVVRRVQSIGLDVEIVIVDDGSTDGTQQVLQGLKFDNCRVLLHDRNRGKGAAIRTALREVKGDAVVVQDADLEYDPRDLRTLMSTLAANGTSVVYGSRNLKGNVRSYSTFYWGGRVVSWLTTLLYGCHITDEPTCYKMFRANLIKSLDLKSEGFDFCPEITAKVLRLGHKIVEVPISYSPRNFAEGKKIRWTDGLRAIWVLVRYRFFQ
jgi:dolichol-phosphate mannosyltransferase